MEGINVTKKEKMQVNKVFAFLKKITPSREGVLVVTTSVILSIVVFGLI